MLCCVIGAIFLSQIYAAFAWMSARLGRSAQPGDAAAWVPSAEATIGSRRGAAVERRALRAKRTLIALSGLAAILILASSFQLFGATPLCGGSWLVHFGQLQTEV